MTDRIIDTDVLVIGGGGAGFRAAIAAREKGARTLLLSKGPLGRCGATPMAGADLTADGKSIKEMGFNGDPRDDKETFFNDIIAHGFFLNNQKLVDQYVQAAPDRLKELLDWGLKVDASEERAIYCSGIGIMNALLKQARQIGVDTLEDIMMIDLCVDGNQVTGGLGLEIRTGEFIRFSCKSVIIASGGWHKAFWPNTGMRDLSGDGIAMAHRAGAEIGNMEFITFCCNVLFSPRNCLGSLATYILHTECGGKITNALGETFLDKYDPYTVLKGTTMEWNKCFISYATAREIREHKATPAGGVFYSRGDVPLEKFMEMAGTFFPKWKWKSLDLREVGQRLESGEAVEVGAAVEYFDGGIVVNEKFETAIMGLYAAGECTLGPFGANRVCAATTEMLVQGAEAGWNAGEYIKGIDKLMPDKHQLEVLEQNALRPLISKGRLSPGKIRRSVQNAAQQHLGPIRHHDGLNDFISFLDTVKREQLPDIRTSSDSRIYNKEWVDALELENLVHLLESAAKSALYRTESRGVHFREDFPQTDNDNWLKETIVHLENHEISVGSRPITVTHLSPPGGVIPYLDMLKQMMELHSDIGGHH